MTSDIALEVQRLFKHSFAHAPTHTVAAPGRLELLGNPAGENEGLALVAAIDRCIAIACSPRADGRVDLVSGAFPGRDTFFLSNIRRNPAASWTDYLKGVLLELRRHGIHFSGFNAAVHGNLPDGAGVGASAALTVAGAMMIRQLHPYTITETGSTIPPRRNRRGELRALKPAERRHLARLCHRAETGFARASGHLLDPLASLSGKAFHALQMDARHDTAEPVPMIGEIALVLCPSGRRSGSAAESLAGLRQTFASASRALGVPSLRHVDLRDLKSHRRRLTQREFECAYHVVAENQRVIHGEQALRNDDFAQFGEFMWQSHESSRDHLGNSSPALELLVDLARDHPATLGARLSGPGFGGSTVNLVRRNKVELFLEYMALHFERRAGRPLRPLLCQVVDGAR